MKSGDIVVCNGMIGTVGEGLNDFYFRPCEGLYCCDYIEHITNKDVKEATHEEKLKLIKAEFIWGYLISIHCIGNYQIVEYENKNTHDILWHGFVDYKDTACHYRSLDSALIGCIGIKHEVFKGKASMYFEKMIGLE